MSSGLDELARATPATRDRYVDFLRAASIVAVVFGHWFISINHLEGDIYSTASAVGLTSGMWLGTWLFQVMPVFFFVGGFSNLVAYDSFRRRGEPTSAFVRSRLERLLRPSLVFLAFWLVVQVALHLSDVGGAAGPRLIGQTRLRHVPAGRDVAVRAAVVPRVLPRGRVRRAADDPLAPAVPLVGPGRDGGGRDRGRRRQLRRRPPPAPVPERRVRPVAPAPARALLRGRDVGRLLRWVFWAMVFVGLGGLVLLTTPWAFEPFGAARFDWFPGIGHYPKSLLGTDVEEVSNAYPPTLCFLLADVWSIGAVMLLRSRLSRWLERPRPWTITIFLNSVIMTLFLWHMTAYFVVLLALWPWGVGQQQESTLGWWLLRPVFIGLSALVLAGIVALVGRFERPRGRSPAT